MSQEVVIRCDYTSTATAERCRRLADRKCDICGCDGCNEHTGHVLRLLFTIAMAATQPTNPDRVMTMSQGLSVCARCATELGGLSDVHTLYRDLLAHQLQELRDRTRAGLAQQALLQGRPSQP